MLSWNDILILLPELYLVAAVCVLLLMDAFIRPEQRNATHWLAIVITAITAFLVVMRAAAGRARRPSAACSCAIASARS